MSAHEQQNEVAKSELELTSGSICKLPGDVMVNILSRLPVKSVFSCKVVSKPWIYELSSSEFARTHFKRAPHSPLLIEYDPYMKLKKVSICLAEGETHSDVMNHFGGQSRLMSEREFLLPDDVSPCPPPIIRGQHQQGNHSITSCNGLLCIPTCNGRFPVIILNPVTGEFFTVQRPKESGPIFPVATIFIGLGFNHSSNKFMLLRMALRALGDDPKKGTPSSVWGLELLDLGGGCGGGGGGNWRPVVDMWDCKEEFFLKNIVETIYIDGSIYWLFREFHFIYSFDFQKESYHVFPMPGTDDKQVEVGWRGHRKNSPLLGLLGGSLTLSKTNILDRNIHIWILNQFDGLQVSWNKVACIPILPYPSNEELYLEDFNQYKPIKYLEGGILLMHHHSGHDIFTYDPVMETMSLLSMPEDPLKCCTKSSALEVKVVPHIPSFVRLKDAIEGIDVKVAETLPNSQAETSNREGVSNLESRMHGS